MQLYKKIPFLLGWSAFYLSALLLSWLLGLWILPFLGKIFPRLTPIASLMLLLGLSFVIGFFVFSFSVGKLVLPLYQNQDRRAPANETARITFGSYFLGWLLYCVFSVVYCIPLYFHGLLPAEIEKPVYLVWQIIASFLAYRGVVCSWLDDFILQHKQDDKNQVMTAC
jgi:hypothetical protein